MAKTGAGGLTADEHGPHNRGYEAKDFKAAEGETRAAVKGAAGQAIHKSRHACS